MKYCAYCGQDNDDAAVACQDCGRGDFRPDATSGAEQPPGQESGTGLLSDLPRLFRVVVVGSTVTYVVWFSYTYLVWIAHVELGRQLVSKRTLDALSWHGHAALLPMPPSLGWLSLLLWVAVAVGLYRFSRSARRAFVALTVFNLLYALLAGVQVQTAFGSFLSVIVGLGDGAILALAYASPLKGRFPQL